MQGICGLSSVVTAYLRLPQECRLANCKSCCLFRSTEDVEVSRLTFICRSIHKAHSKLLKLHEDV